MERDDSGSGLFDPVIPSDARNLGGVSPARTDSTGIVVSDDERLILRPSPLLFRRRSSLRIAAGFYLMSVAGAIALAYLLRPHVSYATAVVCATAVAAVVLYQLTTQVTLIALRGSDGIYVERRSRLMRTRRRTLFHRYADVAAVRVRSRVNPNAARPGVSPMGSYIHYDVLLDDGKRVRMLWYTKYPDCALHIAGQIAAFAGAPVVNETGAAAATS